MLVACQEQPIGDPELLLRNSGFELQTAQLSMNDSPHQNVFSGMVVGMALLSNMLGHHVVEVVELVVVLVN